MRSDGGLSRKFEGQLREDEGQPGRNGECGDVFEERLNKMDTTYLKANHEKSEAMPEHWEAPK
jgi:hypothetical protein